MSNDEHVYLWGRRDRLFQRVELSILYHQKRERMFDVLDKGAKAIAIFGGSAAFAGVGGKDIISYTAATIAATSTIALVGGFAEKSRRHSELARSLREFQADCCHGGERDFTEENLNAWESRLHRIEASEPPALSALVTLCHNELNIAAGHPELVVHMSAWRRWLAPFVDIEAKPHRA